MYGVFYIGLYVMCMVCFYIGLYVMCMSVLKEMSMTLVLCVLSLKIAFVFLTLPVVILRIYFWHFISSRNHNGCLILTINCAAVLSATKSTAQTRTAPCCANKNSTCASDASRVLFHRAVERWHCYIQKGNPLTWNGLKLTDTTCLHQWQSAQIGRSMKPPIVLRDV